jgi:hypothetical protein
MLPLPSANQSPASINSPELDLIPQWIAAAAEASCVGRKKK